MSVKGDSSQAQNDRTDDDGNGNELSWNFKIKD